VVAEGELLADFPVGVLDDVVRVRVDPDERGDLDFEAGLFFHLADRAVFDRFAEFHAAAREGQESVVRGAPAGSVLRSR
jgi:hypothetical protein